MRAARPWAWKSPGTFATAAQRLVALAAGEQDARERHGGVGARGLELERAAQRRLVAGGGEPLGLGRDEPVEEALDLLAAAARR